MIKLARPTIRTAVVSRRALWLLLGVATPAATLLAAAGLWPLWRRDVPLGLANTAVFAALFAIGMVLLAEPEQWAPGAAMVASAALLVVSWTNEWGTGPLPLLSKLVGSLWLLAGGWALYRYPDPRLSRDDRWMFRLMLAWFVATPWLLVLTSRPEWHQFPAHVWWPTAWADHRAWRVLSQITDVVTVGMAVLYVTRWASRLRRASPAERRLKKPTTVGAIVAACLGVTIPVGYAAGLPNAGMDVLYTIAAFGLLAVPVAFLVAVIRRQLARTALTDLLLRLSRHPSTPDVVRVLRETLEDPNLQVVYWSTTQQAYVDDERRPVPEPGRAASRLITEVRSSTDEPLARVLVDPALHRDPEFVQATVAAFSLTLENALLLETVQAQLAELRAASSRIVQAGVAERRRLEQDLHDGAQVHFLALGPLLGAVEATTADPRTAAELAEIRAQLARALKELRELAHGIHPTLLRAGLATAVDEACRRHPFAVTADLPDAPLPEATALTAYLAISEAVANVAKHAQARSVRISGSIEAGTLRITVTDDGRGGASPTGGTGLTSIIDRITALGGQVQIVSPEGAGTRLTMQLPCE